MSVLLNDIHSRLNPCEVADVVSPRDEGDVVRAVERANREGLKVSVAGGRHAMGGQQFGAGTLHIDCTGLTAVHGFDSERGLLHIGAGADWPTIIRACHEAQPGEHKPWGIRQKQTGADTLTLGGAVAANVHGRGLLMSPIGDDIEEFTLVTPGATLVRCSRDQNAELFSLVIGGYGLFGVVTSAVLRLGPRVRLRRVVDIIDIDDAMNAVYRRIGEGCIYGDFQYAIDPSDDSFLRRGVFACYKPVDPRTPVSDASADLTREAWLGLLKLAHTDKGEAFRLYALHYLDTHGRVYWSDSMQLSTYIPSYAEFLSRALDTTVPQSLMITELYTPPDQLIAFMGRARAVLHETGVEDIYGTIRAIRQDRVSFLPWAQGDRACVIFNLRTEHTAAGVAKSAAAARGLIDAALGFGGSFYLTYHRWATRGQLLRGHPRLPEFMARKRAHDERGVFTSDWWSAVCASVEGDRVAGVGA